MVQNPPTPPSAVHRAEEAVGHSLVFIPECVQLWSRELETPRYLALQ